MNSKSLFILISILSVTFCGKWELQYSAFTESSFTQESLKNWIPEGFSEN